MINTKINKYLSVTQHQVTESVRKYFVDKPKVTIRFIPKTEGTNTVVNSNDA